MNKALFRSRRFFLVAGVAGAVFLAAGVAFVLTGSRGGTSEEPARGAAPPAPTPAPATGGNAGQAVTDQLKAQVAAGRLDQTVFDAITAKGEAEALVVLDDERAQESLKQAAAARGWRLDDERINELKPVIYAEIKRQVAAAAPDQAKTVEDFESFGVAKVRFTTAQALLETLRRPEIAGVREIQEYTRPG